MTTIEVHASRNYEVRIERGSLQRCGEQLRALCGAGLAVLVTDTNVDALYADTVTASMCAAGFHTEKFTIPAGERSKNGETYLKLLNFLTQCGLTRSDTVVSLGGGVVGDLAGFAAATYLRGVGFVQLPTTLLAMADASVGGKTAIDLPGGKNLAGAFYQPKLVLCDPDVLQTLPQETLSDGCAEIIKYGMIADTQLLTMLRSPLQPQLEQVLARCIVCKRDLVEKDEFDIGARQLLNFGHTLGHAIELLSGYTLSHGKAVAIGMAAMTMACERAEICPDGLYWELHDLLQQYQLPTSLPYRAAELTAAAFHDKKRNGDTIHIVTPCSRGRCCVQQVSMEDLGALLARCED